jgi:hypothetical protein
MAGASVAAPPQADRTRLARTTSENKKVSWRFTVSPPRIESWIQMEILGMKLLHQMPRITSFGKEYADYTAK